MKIEESVKLEFLLFVSASLDQVDSSKNVEEKNQDPLKEILDKEWKKLGSIKPGEYWVGGCFLVLILLWFTQNPRFFPGWGE